MSGISEKDILATIRALEAEDEKVTIEAIRSRLGGGSFSTIQPVLKRWRNQSAQNLVAPQEIQNIMRDVADQIWSKAEIVASRKFNGHKLELERTISDLKLDTEEKATEIRHLEAELEKAAEKYQELQTEFHSLPDPDEVEAEKMKLKERISTLESILEKLKIDFPKDEDRDDAAE